MRHKRAQRPQWTWWKHWKWQKQQFWWQLQKIVENNLAMKGSKDLNKKDENNNFVKNYKNLWDALWHQAWEGPKSPTKMIKVTIFAENDKNTLRAMAWGMRGSKDPNKNDENDECNDFSRKLQKSCRWVQRHEGWRKQQFEWDYLNWLSWMTGSC